MSDTSTRFIDNTVFYDSKIPASSSVELVTNGIGIDAGQKVPNISGFNHEVICRFSPGIPPEVIVNFFATSFSQWAPRETVTVTGESIS